MAYFDKKKGNDVYHGLRSLFDIDVKIYEESIVNIEIYKED